MNAVVGDRLRFLGHKVGDHDRVGRVVEVLGSDGGPPYLVEFEDGHRGEAFPGSDCEIEHGGEREPERSTSRPSRPPRAISASSPSPVSTTDGASHSGSSTTIRVPDRSPVLPLACSARGRPNARSSRDRPFRAQPAPSPARRAGSGGPPDARPPTSCASCTGILCASRCSPDRGLREH
ncbi:hypothetical protein DN069_22830 [Streptacidiphilus pinicola]|uniref:DUF1918 domain-containing protein n=1 Tax=Streptacidiphilus pinicola TaxID=2219663 RepID=A0A2X0K257_9ACTN|nr:hypothetical protein DN069_22830 [Streptacidiphilus pinicola]